LLILLIKRPTMRADPHVRKDEAAARKIKA
jgi:hypothetical protein